MPLQLPTRTVHRTSSEVRKGIHVEFVSAIEERFPDQDDAPETLANHTIRADYDKLMTLWE